MKTKKFSSFKEFYPFYLAEHSRPATRRLHLLGLTVGLAAVGVAIATQQWPWLLLLPVSGYGFGWLGHFLFEKNRPTTLHYPLYSLLSDFAMCRDLLLRRIK